MKVSYLLDILVGCVGNIDELSVGKVGKKVPIGLPPVLGCLWWHGESVGCWLCDVECGWWAGGGHHMKNMTVLQFQ
jgi:hypothetical protein